MPAVTDPHRFTYQKGLWAERAAEVALRFKGYRVLARRYKTRKGEVDLIVVRGRALVFVEVKYRPDLEAGLQAVPVHQITRVQDAASRYLQQNPYFGAFDQRLDLVVVRPWRWPSHIENFASA